MATQDQDHAVELRDFRPGLISAEPPAELPAGAAQSCSNMYLTRGGSLGVRPGRMSYSTDAPPSPATSTGTATLDGVVHLLAATPTAAWAGVPDDLKAITGWAPGSSVNMPDMAATFIRYADKWMGINEAQFQELTYNTGTSTWSAATMTTVVPRGVLSCIHNNIMFVSGNDGDPRKVFFCEPYAPLTDWPTNGWFQVSPSRGDPITGITSFQGLMYVFTAKDGFVIQGYDWADMTDVVIARMDVTDGCVAPRSLISHPVGMFWMGNDGIYQGQGRQAKRISDAVGNYFGDEHDNTWSCVTSTADWIAWSLASEAGPRGTLVFDLRHKSWTFWDIGAYCWFPYGPKGIASFQDASDGRIRYLAPDHCPDEGNEAIPWMWRSGIFAPAGSPFLRAQFTRGQFMVSAKGGTTALTSNHRWDFNPARYSVQEQVRVAGTNWEPQARSLSLTGAGHFLDLELGALVVTPFVLEGLLIASKAIVPA